MVKRNWQFSNVHRKFPFRYANYRIDSTNMSDIDEWCDENFGPIGIGYDAYNRHWYFKTQEDLSFVILKWGINDYDQQSICCQNK